MSVLGKLVVVMIAEVLALVAVAERIGPLDAIALLILVSLCGPALVRRSGVSGIRRAYRVMRNGPSPGAEGSPAAEGIDVLLRLTGGLLVCIPGFLTDIAGLALWVPPVRAAVRRRLQRRQAQLLVDRFGRLPGDARPGAGYDPAGDEVVVDAASHPLRDDQRPRPPLDR